MKFASIDTVITQQALISGQVQDSITGGVPLAPVQIELRYQTPPDDPPRAFPLAARLLPGGLFCFPGDPQQAFPHLSSGSSLALRLVVSASGYQDQTLDFSLSDTELTPSTLNLTVEGHTVTAPHLNAPLFEAVVQLAPMPVALSGRVVAADDPNQGLENAQIRVTAPSARGPVSSQADGFFFLPDLPVARQVQLRITHADFATPYDQPFFPDYRQPVNQQTFVMS